MIVLRLWCFKELSVLVDLVSRALRGTVFRRRSLMRREAVNGR